MSIQPYQFEPRRPPDQATTSQNSNSTPVNAGGTGGTPGGAPSDQRTLDTFWCRCGNCRIMPTVTECICCAGNRINVTPGVLFVLVQLGAKQTTISKWQFQPNFMSTYNSIYPPFCLAKICNFFNHFDQNLIYYYLPAVWL